LVAAIGRAGIFVTLVYFVVDDNASNQMVDAGTRPAAFG
jgi:hypothetical protein